MEIAMLLIGLLLGGCVTMCVVSGIALNRYNDYESEIRSTAHPQHSCQRKLDGGACLTSSARTHGSCYPKPLGGRA